MSNFDSTNKKEFSRLTWFLMGSGVSLLFLFFIWGIWLLGQQRLKAIQSEARNNVGSLLVAQRYFYADQGYFSDSQKVLGLGLPDETNNYIYKIIIPIDKELMVQMIAQSKKPSLKSYTGIAFFIEKPEPAINVILCESAQPTMEFPPEPRFDQGGMPTCPNEYSDLSS